MSEPEQGATCVCCGGVEGGPVTGGEVDPATGLCVTCQPCPECGEVNPAPFSSTCPVRWWH